MALVRNLVVSQLQVNPSGILFHYSSEIFMGSNGPCLVSIRSHVFSSSGSQCGVAVRCLCVHAAEDVRVGSQGKNFDIQNSLAK